MKITRYTPVRQRSIQFPSGASPSWEGLTQLTDSTQSLMRTIRQLEQADQLRHRQSVSIQAQNLLADEIDRISRLPNWNSYEPEYEQALSDIDDWALGEFQDSDDYQRWTDDFKSAKLIGRIKIRRAAVMQQSVTTLSQTKNDLNMVANLVASADDELDRQLYMEEGYSLVEQQVRNGLLTVPQKDALIDTLENDVIEATLRREIRNQPDIALARLQDFDDALLSKMKSKDRQIWIDRAVTAYEQRLREGEAERKRRNAEADKERKLLEREIAKTAAALDYKNELNIDWLFENQAVMRPADFKYYLERLSDEAGEVLENQIYTQLSERAINGEDVRDEVDRAFSSRQIGKSHRDGIHDIVTGQMGQKSLKAIATRKMIATTFGSDEILSSIPGATARKAEALYAWDKWVIANPDKVDEGEQAEQKAREILKSWQMYPTTLEFFRMKRLRYGPPINSPDMDLKEIANRTVEAFKQGEITRDQLNEEVETLKLLQQLQQEIQNVGTIE